MSKMIEVEIDSVRVSLTNQQRIVVLKEIDRDRYLPIWIGPYEAEAITIALQEIEISRPQTHDLVKNTIENLDARIARIVISDLKDDIFYGTLVIQKDDNEIKIDCRPSDAIAIAVRVHVPIMVAVSVMDQASILPEDYATPSQEEPDLEQSQEGDRLPPGEDRLSIFEDYLKKKGHDDQSDLSDTPTG